MSEPGLLDKWFEEWDTDPDFILEGVLIEATERICELMDKHQISRAELARRLGKSRAYVTRMLNGQPNMTLKTLTQIAVALGEGIDVFVPSSVTEERQRLLEARLAAERGQQIVVEQEQWRNGGVVVSGDLRRPGADDGEPPSYEPVAA